MNEHILIIETDGEVPRREVRGDLLKELQDACGGYIETVEITGGYRMCVNETGLLDGLVYNALASEIWGAEIVGPAAICAVGEVNGEPGLIPLTKEDEEITDRIVSMTRKAVRRI